MATEFPPVMDFDLEHFPYCLVWSPLPVLTVLLPFVGHIGIADSQGKLYDFQGDFSIGADKMLFGRVVRYLDLSRLSVPSAYATPKGSAEQVQEQVRSYDEAVLGMVRYFRRSQHYDFLNNNCHHFAAAALNSNQSDSVALPKWSLIRIMWQMFIHGKFVSWSLFISAIWKSVVLYLSIIYFFVYMV